jgi:CelD/BcsL family acetyltransferase involved in cellulose biosynthesis
VSAEDVRLVRAAFERLGWNMTPVNSLEARIAEMDARWQELERPFDKSEYDVMFTRAEAAEARVKALRQYVAHRPTCTLAISRSVLRKAEWCSCGLTDLLALAADEPYADIPGSGQRGCG